MSILIGIVCSEAIILASDSKTTFMSLGGAHQRLDAQKINVLQFSDSIALVAQSGNEDVSARVIEILKDLTEGETISDYRTVADKAQEAMRQMKSELRHQQLDCSVEELRQYMRANGLDCELMIAHYKSGKPCVFTINSDVGMASKKTGRYTAIGSGKPTADYILSWFNFDEHTPYQYGMLAAIYAIEEVKKVETYCGGKTKLAVIPSNNFAAGPKPGMSQNEIAEWMLKFDHDDYAAALENIDKQTKAQWGKRFNDALEQVHSKHQSRIKNSERNTP